MKKLTNRILITSLILSACVIGYLYLKDDFNRIKPTVAPTIIGRDDIGNMQPDKKLDEYLKDRDKDLQTAPPASAPPEVDNRGVAAKDLPLAFVRPNMDAAIEYYEEAITAEKAKQSDAVFFLSQLKYSWSSQHKNALPSEPYIACVLFQFGGIKPIIHVQYSKFDDELNDTKERAFAFVDKFDDNDIKTAEKIKYWLKWYAVSCDAHLNGRPAPSDLGP